MSDNHSVKQLLKNIDPKVLIVLVLHPSQDVRTKIMKVSRI